MKKQVNMFVMKCKICWLAKGANQKIRLYTQWSFLKIPCEDISMDFVLGLPQTQQGYDPIFVVVDKISNMEHFFVCKKCNDGNNVTNLFFKEVVGLHNVLRPWLTERICSYCS